MIGQDIMRVAAVRRGVGVDERGGQPRDRVQQGVLSADSDLVRLRGGDVRVDDYLAFSADLVADPAQPDLPGIQHAGGGAQGALGLVHERGSTASISRR